MTLVVVDRSIGEEANRLCRKYEDEGLSPCDAIHLACAKRAGCDVLLTWDDVLIGLNGKESGIRIEYPRIQELPEREPIEEKLYTHQIDLFKKPSDDIDAESPEDEQVTREEEEGKPKNQS